MEVYTEISESFDVIIHIKIPFKNVSKTAIFVYQDALVLVAETFFSTIINNTCTRCLMHGYEKFITEYEKI